MTGLTPTEFITLKKIINDNEKTDKDISNVDKILKNASELTLSSYFKKNSITDEKEKENFKWKNAYRIFQTTATSVSFTKKLKSYIKAENITDKFFSYLTPQKELYIIRNIYNSDSKKPRVQVLFADEYLDVNPGDFWWDIKTTGLDNEGKVPFKNGKKPIALMERLLSIGTNSGSIILDFFSGSATTAHAVMQLNAEDGGNRKYIMVQIPEATEEKSEAYKAGYQNICEIGKERIRRAAQKIKEENPGAEFDDGFRVLKADSSNIKDVYLNAENYTQESLVTLNEKIKEDRTAEDLLYQVMLQTGVLLSSSIEEISLGSAKVYNVADGYLMACFESQLGEETIRQMAEYQPYFAVFMESAAMEDTTKVNIQQIFKSLSPSTEVKVL